MTILEGNKAIAEFMGWTYFGWNDTRLIKEDGTTYESGWKKDIKSPMITKLRRSSNHKNLKYNTSWDWLMPVYSKVATIWSGLGTKQQGQVKDIKKALQNRLILAEINGVWEFCTLFIKWYNENK